MLTICCQVFPDLIVSAFIHLQTNFFFDGKCDKLSSLYIQPFAYVIHQITEICSLNEKTLLFMTIWYLPKVNWHFKPLKRSKNFLFMFICNICNSRKCLLISSLPMYLCNFILWSWTLLLFIKYPWMTLVHHYRRMIRKLFCTIVLHV